MPFAEDFSVFFDVDGFGSEFTYISKIGAEITVKGIFDSAYFEVNDDGVGVASNQPRIVYESVNIPDPTYGEKVIINDKHYIIVGIQPDGTGTTTLMLEVQDDPC